MILIFFFFIKELGYLSLTAICACNDNDLMTLD